MTAKEQGLLAILFWLPFATYLAWRVMHTEPGQMNDEDCDHDSH